MAPPPVRKWQEAAVPPHQQQKAQTPPPPTAKNGLTKCRLLLPPCLQGVDATWEPDHPHLWGVQEADILVDSVNSRPGVGSRLRRRVPAVTAEAVGPAAAAGVGLRSRRRSIGVPTGSCGVCIPSQQGRWWLSICLCLDGGWPEVVL